MDGNNARALSRGLSDRNLAESDRGEREKLETTKRRNNENIDGCKGSQAKERKGGGRGGKPLFLTEQAVLTKG